MDIPKLFGILGLLLISTGVLIKNRQREDILYMFGGIFLEVYSLHIHDGIFSILQIIFIISAGISFAKTMREKKKTR